MNAKLYRNKVHGTFFINLVNELLAGSFLLITSTLTVIGTLISDILLAIVDPRINLD